MKISVIIPAYNEASFLPKVLLSLKNQAFSLPYEIIVVDNNSTDNTACIAKEFGATVVFEPRRGIVYARQKGVNAAKGEIIVGLDADCVMPKNFLSNILKRFNDKALVGLCGTVFFDDAPLVIRLFARLFTMYGHYYSKFLNKAPICWALNFSFRRNDFMKIGGYNLNLPMVIAGYNTQGSDEYDLVKRLIKDARKTVLFDKNITLQTSGRRFKNRLLYWLFIEHIFGFTINEKLYNLFGILLPMQSYYDRITPKKLYNYALNGIFFFLVFLIIMPFIYMKLYPSQSFLLAEKAQNQLKLVHGLKADLQTLRGFFSLQ